MGKIRLYVLAKELGISNTELVDILKDLGIAVKSHMSTLEEETANLVIEMLSEEKEVDTKDAKKIILPQSATLQTVGDKINKKTNELMKALIEKGLMITVNQELSPSDLIRLGEIFGYDFVQELKEEVDEQEDIQGEVPAKDLKPRPPVVTIMGHVDHGKTLLLDTIRETNVIASEAGGITQHIGAYQVKIKGKKITFLDTPGHEAFTAMRARGAKATDIAILVVAADDGIMPQTVEAINHARSAEIPIIVAINKIDRVNANPERVKQQLTDHGLVPEEWGGETICVEVSALKKLNIDDLLEMILLVAEMEDLKAVAKGHAEGVVIDAKLDKGRGAVATVLVQKGVLKIGDPVVIGKTYGRVRAMFNDLTERVDKAYPSTPVEVLGIAEVPDAGDQVKVVKTEKIARTIAQQKAQLAKEEIRGVSRSMNLEQFYSKIKEDQIKELRLILKCDVHGSAEALRESLERIKSEEVKLDIIHCGVGGITESDVILAAAANAVIIGFNVRPDNNAAKVSERENVDIRTYRIIYQIIDDIKKALEGLLEPEIKEKVIGRAQVRQTFKVPKIGTVAGLYVQQGKITRNSMIRVIRNGIVVHEGKIDSLKRFQDDVREVEENYECGLGLENFQDIKEGDTLEAYILEEIKRILE